MGSQANRVLLLFPQEFLEKEAPQDHRVSKDQRGGLENQDHRAPLGIQALWDPSGRRACLGLVVDQGCLDFVEMLDKWATLAYKAWKVGVETLVSPGYPVCLAAASAWATCW